MSRQHQWQPLWSSHLAAGVVGEGDDLVGARLAEVEAVRVGASCLLHRHVATTRVEVTAGHRHTGLKEGRGGVGGEERESSWRGWRTSEGRRRSKGRGARGGGALVEAWRAKETDGIACASLLQDMGRDQGGGVGDGTGNGKEGRERERAQGMQSRFLNPSRTHAQTESTTHTLSC